MVSEQHRKVLLAIGKQLRSELDHEPKKPRPDMERALRRLLERDVAERSRPTTKWTGKQK